MKPERWREVTQIYGAVVSRAPEQRAAAVAELCGTDADLRREIESLLESQHGATLLNRPASDHGSMMQMVLSIGSQIGVFRIDSLLGVGGMGEVYRAHDTKLNRDVAIKILPPVLANAPDRLSRFKREAQLLASLNHSNIAAIYGFEDSGNVHALVLELVEGLTLADRIARGPIDIIEALPIARQVAEALEAAHEQGIIHRDLKPANIKIRDDGIVKVLDFGLAKLVEGPARTGQYDGPTLTQSPTITTPAMTSAGVILGTAAYMAPEQARGFTTDHRSDVFSFGVVVYEVLTGRKPFPGETVADILASILAREPDLTALPPNLNPRLVELIRRCLDKNPKRRWQAIGDVRAELELIAASPALISSDRARRQPISAWKIASVVGISAVVSGSIAAYAVWQIRPTEKRAVVRLTASLAPGQQFTPLGRRAIAISPDGQSIVYVADGRLFLRSLSQDDPVPIKGSEVSGSVPLNAPGFSPLMNNPVFSPDGQFVAYYVGGAIRKLPIAGGTAITLSQVSNVVGMSWSSNGVIVSESNAIKRVADGGGEPELLVPINQDVATDAQMLPDGRTLLFSIAADPAGRRSRIFAQAIPAGTPKLIVEDAGDPRYLPDGTLIFARGGNLLGAQFDLRQLRLTSNPVPVLEGVRRGGNSGGGAAQFALSDTGSLAYIRGPAFASSSQRGLTLIDMKGNRQALNVPQKAYNFPRVSPDGNWLVVDVDEPNDSSIYTYPLSGDSQIRRLTLSGHNRHPIWTPDSRRITFQSDAFGDAGIFSQRADGTEPPQRLTTSPAGTAHIPESWSPDGKVLLFAVQKDGLYELQRYSVDDKRIDRVADIKSMYPPGSTFSRDGRVIAYYQRDPGRPAGSLFVRPYPDGLRHEVVNGGGIHPMWMLGNDPMRLAYRLPATTNVVGVSLQPQFELDPPMELPLGVLFNAGPSASRNMDFVASRNAFVVVMLSPSQDVDAQANVQAIQIVINWSEELKQHLLGRP